MVVHQKKSLSVFALVLFLTAISTVTVSPVIAAESPLWEAQVSGSGQEVVSPVLKTGKEYRIVAEGRWAYDGWNNLAADAKYYTTNPSDWDWENYFPAPDGHSFLQIDGGDVEWGPFSNGDTGHIYTIQYTGAGTTITFRIVDWVDSDYGNNGCKMVVKIYEHITSVGGYALVTTATEETSPITIVRPEALFGILVAATICLFALSFKPRVSKQR